MNTIENNILIAEFLGWEIEETLGGLNVYIIKTQNPNKENDTQTEFYEAKELLYHKDWNWLIKGIEKMGSLSFKETKGLEKLVEKYFSTDTNQLFIGIKNVYNNFVKFIKEYNQLILNS